MLHVTSKEKALRSLTHYILYTSTLIIVPPHRPSTSTLVLLDHNDNDNNNYNHHNHKREETSPSRLVLRIIVFRPTLRASEPPLPFEVVTATLIFTLDINGTFLTSWLLERIPPLMTSRAPAGNWLSLMTDGTLCRSLVCSIGARLALTF